MKSEIEEINADVSGCPFCGCKFFKQKFEVGAIPKDGSGRVHFMYKCPKCRTQFALPLMKTHDEAIGFWNARAEAINSHLPNQAKIKELEKEKAELLEVATAVLKYQQCGISFEKLVRKTKQAIEKVK